MTKLIHAAGLAIQALTNSKSPAESSSPTGNTLEAHKAAFKAATSQYFALLSSIDVRLRRQVYALEEAGILAPDSAASRPSEAAGAGTAGGAANPLDISWLNSRKDTVGKDKEAELWAAAREFVERIGTSSSSSSSSSTGEEPGKAGKGDEKMEVD